MPALVIFGRRTILAGDDLRIACCLLLLLRALQLTLAIIVLSLLPSAIHQLDSVCTSINSGDNDNGGAPLVILISYGSTTIALAIVSVVLLTLIWRISTQGTPTETEARKQLTPLCQLRLISITTLRLIALGLGCAALSLVNRFCTCEHELSLSYNENTDAAQQAQASQQEGPLLILKRRACGNDDELQFCLFILVVSHFVEVVCSLAMGVKLFLLPHVPRPSSGTIVSPQTKWLWGCTCCCTIASLLTCCTLGGTEAIRGGDDHFADICATLVDFFDCDFNDKDHPLDVAPTDLMAAFLLLLREQKQLQLELQETLLQTQQSQKEPHAQPESPYDNDKRQTKEHPYHDEDEYENEDETDDVEEQGHDLEASHISSNIPLLRHSDSRPFYELAEREILSKDNPFDVFTIAEGAHFMHISKAIYTWLMYIMYNPCTGPCQLGGSCFMDSFTCRNRRRRHHHQPQDPHHIKMEGETCCGWHERALLHEAGLTHSDILYAQFKVGVAQTPYCIAVDHEWESIVIAIRGTFSLEDAVADLQVRPEPLDECGNKCGFDGRAQYCHAGVFACAQWIYNDVEQHGILEKVLLGDLSTSTTGRYANYKLRIVGHSLGAGCAAMLSFMLKSKYPNLKCLAFEPPGCTLSLGLAQSCDDFTTSFVNDTDLVPRLSIHAMNNFRNDLLEIIARIKVPKYQLINDGIVCCRRTKKRASNEDLLHSKDSIPVSNFSQQLANFKAAQEAKKEGA